jgi:uncharacterized protein (DUF1778 family)
MAAVLRQRVDDTASQQSLRANYTSAACAADPLEINRDIRLSNRDFKLFLVTLESDEVPNDALSQAAQSYKQKYG